MTDKPYKAFLVEVEVYLQNTEDIDVDTIVANNEVEDALENQAMRNFNLITGSTIKSVREIEDE